MNTKAVTVHSRSQSGRHQGQCPTCLRSISLTSGGVLHKHGSGSGCAGTGQRPMSHVGSDVNNQSRLDLTTTSFSDPTQQLTSAERFDIVEFLRSRKPRLLKRIPKASRVLAAEKLSFLLSAVNDNPDNVEAWNRLLMFPKCCLCVPNQRGGKTKNLATKINKQLNAFPSTVAECESFENSRTRKSKSSKNVDSFIQLARRVSEKIEDGDIRGAIKLAASDDTLAPHNTITLSALREKHPAKSTTPDDWLHSSSSVSVSLPFISQTEEIVGAIRSFPNGSAGGLDGLRPQHLKELTSGQCGQASEQLIENLTQFINIVFKGGVPAIIRPLFCGASLFALTKKDGGIRPIAVGCTLRRLAAKVAARLVSSDAASILMPHQIGVGVKLGAEAAAHAGRSYINNLATGQAVFKLDFKNAFNSIHRDVILSAVHEKIPRLQPFVELCYAESSNLCFGDEIIMSEEGAQQGDPLGSLLFCLAIHRLVEKLSSELNLWYIDDGILGGNITDILHDIDIIKTDGQKIGMKLNESKCELITPDEEVIKTVRLTLPSVNCVKPRDAIVLGAPVGGSGAINSVLSQKLAEFQRLADRLKRLNTHDGFYLLKNCFSLPKLMYILRCAPCHSNSLIEQYDITIRKTLQSILNVALTDDCWDQAKLPVNLGGLGVLAADDIALPAFIASVIGSAALTLQILPTSLAHIAGTNDQHFIHYVKEWQSITHTESLDMSTDAEQKRWSHPLQVIAAEAVLSAAPNQASRARLIAAAAPSSGAFLHVIPMSSIGTRLDDTSMRIAVALRLGASLCTPHQCICGATVDASGTHGLSCRKSAGRIARHTAINGIIKAALTAAETQCRLEPRGLARDDGKRPDGVTTIPWKEGRCLMWDVTCPDTLAPSYLDKAVTGPGVVATEAELRKRQKYSSINAASYIFQPIAIETLGAFGNDATDFITELGRRLQIVTQDTRARMFLLQRLSVAMQRGNAACVLGTASEKAGHEDDFFV